MDRRRRTRIALALGLLVLVALAWWLAAPRVLATEYASFSRPDGAYKVVVVRYPVWPGVMPGQSGDAPGAVRLYDRRGKLLRETRVPMVQLVDQVSWEGRQVRIKSVAEWNLPD